MLATVASSTSANRIKRSLMASGINTVVVQTPAPLTKEGCGYSIRFDDSLKPTVEQTALELGINIRAFYSEKIVDGKRKYFKEI